MDVVYAAVDSQGNVNLMHPDLPEPRTKSFNSAPIVTLYGPTYASEGDTKTYTFYISDPDYDSVSVQDGYPTCGGNGILVDTTPISDCEYNCGGTFKCYFPDFRTNLLVKSI